MFLLAFFNLNAQSDSIRIDSSAFFKEVVLESLFTKEKINELNTKEKIIFSKENNVKYSYFFLFILNLLFIAVLLFNVSRAKVKKLTATLFSLNVLSQFSRVEEKRDNQFLWAYLVQVLMFLSLFLVLITYKFKIEIDVVSISFGIFVFLLVDILVHNVSSFLFNKKELKTSVHFNNFSFVIISLPILIIAVLFILFSDIDYSRIIIYVYLGILFLLYLAKEFRNIIILKANRVNIFSFYFFIYLCTFKFLPLIVLFKKIAGEIIKTI